jgi:hypothetical protein
VRYRLWVADPLSSQLSPVPGAWLPARPIFRRRRRSRSSARRSCSTPTRASPTTHAGRAGPPRPAATSCGRPKTRPRPNEWLRSARATIYNRAGAPTRDLQHGALVKWRARRSIGSDLSPSVVRARPVVAAAWREGPGRRSGVPPARGRGERGLVSCLRLDEPRQPDGCGSRRLCRWCGRGRDREEAPRLLELRRP